MWVPLHCSATDDKSIEAVRTYEPIKIDGVLNERIWKMAPRATDFVQRLPRPGALPSQPSEVSIVYDDHAVYIAAWLYDAHPDSIRTELTGRDKIGFSDAFSIYFDTFDDDLNAFEFTLSASGIQTDRQYSPAGKDLNWNAGWYSEVVINEYGWFLEIEIPMAALRFPKVVEQRWGVNFRRIIRRANEQAYWSAIDPANDGFVNQFGRLTGIKNIKSPLRLSVSPYLSYALSNYQDNSENINQTASNVRGGLDLKYGITDAFTLDMMLIPDFGQVVSDNKVLNLSPFEVYYSENRQFFIEGTDLFDKGGYFYSRRIGGQPLRFGDVEDGLMPGEEIVRNPTESKIVNATKVTGRTRKGLGLGFLNAVTSATHAVVEDEAGGRREVMTSPLANYNVFVIDQSLKNNSYINFINTNVSRASGFYDANLTGANVKFADRSNTYAIYGGGAMAQQYGHADAPAEQGYQASVAARKISGRYQYGLRYRLETENYDPNDLGYARAPNDNDLTLDLDYKRFDPFGKFLNFAAGFAVNYQRLFSPNLFESLQLESSASATFTNFMSAAVWLSGAPVERYDYNEPRVDGRFLIEPSYISTGASFETDDRKQVSLYTSVDYAKASLAGRYSASLTVAPSMRLSDRFSLSAWLYGKVFDNDVGYVHKANSVVHMGKRKINTVSNVLSSKYTINRKMDVYFRMRHYWSNACYSEFYELKKNGRLGATDYRGDHDVNYNAFNIDMIYTWVFSPASEFSIVWKNAIIGENDQYQSNYMDNMINAFDAAQENSLSIRILYFLDYMMIKRSRKSADGLIARAN
jgi:hypothetical protein